MNRFFSLKAMIFLLLFLHSAYLLHAQQGDGEGLRDLSRYSFGFMYGHGEQYYLNVNYHYQVELFQGQVSYTLAEKKHWSYEVLVQPQFNVSRFRAIDDEPVVEEGMEYGFNAGFLLRREIVDWFNVYACLSAGPHYISGAPRRQTPGFIFSDNLFAGLSVRIVENVHMDFRYGIRHISNAEIQMPNGGVNNMILSGGIMCTFK